MQSGTVLVDKQLYKNYINWRKASRGLKGDFARDQALRAHLELFYSDTKPKDGADLIGVHHPLMVP